MTPTTTTRTTAHPGRLTAAALAAAIAVGSIIGLASTRHPAQRTWPQVAGCFYAHNAAGDTAQDAWEEYDGSLFGVTGCVQTLPATAATRCVHRALSPQVWAKVTEESDPAGRATVAAAVTVCVSR